LTVLRVFQGIGGREWGGSVLISMEWARGGHSNRGSTRPGPNSVYGGGTCMLLAPWPPVSSASSIFIAIVLPLIPHDMQYGPQAALIAEAFTPRLRYSGASLGYQLASIIAGGPGPIIATALFARYRIGDAIAGYIAVCAVISIIATALVPDYTGKDVSSEYDQPG
jgi:hypothetical protein